MDPTDASERAARPQGVAAGRRPHDLHPWVHFLITAPTLVATVDA
jgi:hypothetical protein